MTNDLSTLSFEDLMNELEEMTQRLASGDLGIEEATDLYERATAHHVAATQRLAEIQTRIDALAGDKPSG